VATPAHPTLHWHAEADVEFVHPTVGHDANIGFRHPPAEEQGGRPVIPGFGRNAVHHFIKYLRIIEKQPIKIS